MDSTDLQTTDWGSLLIQPEKRVEQAKKSFDEVITIKEQLMVK
jgi:hypothetical protein